MRQVAVVAWPPPNLPLPRLASKRRTRTWGTGHQAPGQNSLDKRNDYPRIGIMARPRAQGEKELFWIASSYRELVAFPERVKDRIGTALGVAQFGGKHVSAKPWKG